jgi:hypothetical protein
MHPIERLRWIARTDDEPAASLASEAAWTLADLADEEPTALLTACRRLLDRHPSVGPLWWVCACLLGSPDDPLAAGHRASAELCSDPTPAALAKQLRRSFTSGDVIALTSPLELCRPAVETSGRYGVRVVGSRSELSRVVRKLAAAGGDVTAWSSGEEDEALEGASVLIVEVLAAGGGCAILTREASAALEAAERRRVDSWAVIGVGRALPEPLLSAAAERSGDSVEAVDLETFSSAVGPEGPGNAVAVAAACSCPPGTELLRRPV